MTTDPNTEAPNGNASCPHSSETWEAIVTASRTGQAIESSTSAHIERCVECRDAVDRANRLGAAMAALADQIETRAARPESTLASEGTAQLLMRLARYEAWHRAARRACAASAGLAACLAIVWMLVSGVETGAGSRNQGPSIVNRATPTVDDRSMAAAESDAKARTDPFSSAVASAIPVHGWVDLPARGTSPDSTVWWVVLSYGGR
jgi:hypothetical protein